MFGRVKAISFVLCGSLVATGAAVAAGSAATPAAAAPVATIAWQRTFPGVGFVESSVTPATLSNPAYVVGGQDGKVYAFDAGSGGDEPGWPVATGSPINSTPTAVDVRGTGKTDVFIGSGIAAGGNKCPGGGTTAIDPSGAVRWHNVATDPLCGSNTAFHSTFAVGDITGSGVPSATIGALGLEMPSYSAVTGGMNPGWPYYTDDTVFSSPALADVNGDGIPDVIVGGDSSPGGPIDHRGGLVRAVTGGGQTLWQFFTDDIVRSSPAVGDITGTGHPSIVFGTGNYWMAQPGGAHDSTAIFSIDSSGHQQWRTDLGGITVGSPALADVTGTGRLNVIEGTDGAPGNPNVGSIWVLDGNGHPLPQWAGVPSPGGAIIGGITTADLNGDGVQDLLVPTGAGIWAFDGRTAAPMFAMDTGLVSFQNSPLVTDESNGSIGITVAGTQPNGTGVVQHWHVAGGASLGSNGWPMFHHDARHTGNVTPPPLTVSICPFGGHNGYWFVARDGGIFSYCNAAFHGSAGGTPLRAPIIGMVSTKSGHGYWLAGGDGAVFNFGDAPNLGSLAGLPLAQPIVGMARTPSGNGYWLVARDGGIFSFGDAHFFGSTGAVHLNQPIVGMTSTPSGNGYWLVATDGGMFSFGDAHFFGSTGGVHLNQPIVGMARTSSGNGYWLVATDGGMFSFGDAHFFGSTGGVHLNQPIVGMTPTLDGNGYWLVATDGGIFTFGDAVFVGSTGGIRLNQPIAAMAVPSG